MRSESLAFWEPVIRMGGDSFDVGNIHSIRASEDFYASQYRAWLNQLGLSAKPFWITEALVGAQVPGPDQPRPSEDALARLTVSSYARAFASGAGVIFNIGAEAGGLSGGSGRAAERTFVLMAKTLSDFTAVRQLTRNSVLFELPGGRRVYALWDGARLPADVSGTVVVITYAGEESSVNASNVIAQVPILVIKGP